jgi:hypothetical protein
MLLPVAWCREVIDTVTGSGSASCCARAAASTWGGRHQRTLDFCANQELVLFHGRPSSGYPGRLNEVADLLKSPGPAVRLGRVR